MARSFRALSLSFSLITIAAVGCQCDDELSLLPGDLTGIVCSSDTGSGLANVRVIIKDASGKEHELLTGDDGTYSLDKVPAGKATVTIESPDGTREEKVLVEPSKEARLSDEACREPEPPTQPVGTIDGCACDDDRGAWVDGANVYVLTPAGGIYSTATDPVGCFVLPNVPGGAQTVHIEKGAFAETFDVTVEQGQTVTIPTPAICEPRPPDGDVGAIEGRVCAGDGTTWLADADVYVVRGDGTRAADVSDADGRYRVESVPVGAQTLHIEKGSFNITRQVTVVANQTTVIPDEDCELQPPDLKIAVVQGDYDQVEAVLDSLGIDSQNITLYSGYFFDNDNWVGTLLEDFETLSSYDVVFFNCGINDGAWTFSPNNVAMANLRQFVADGGSVYASDWAYDVVEQTWPDFVDFEGNDDLGNNAEKGVSEDTIPGDIIDLNLASAMGQNTIDMDYPLSQWAVMSAVSSQVTLYIRGDATVCTNTFCTNTQQRTNIPHTVGFSPGAGRVLYTSFHQEPGINLDQERVLQLLMFEL